MSRHAAISLHLDSSRAISLHRQPFSGWRWSDSRGPDHRLTGDAFAARGDAVLVNLFHGFAQKHFHAQPFESLFGSSRNVFRKSAQYAVGHVHQNNSSRERVNAPELRAKGGPHHHGEGGSHFNAGRSGSHQHERQEIAMPS